MGSLPESVPDVVRSFGHLLLRRPAFAKPANAPQEVRVCIYDHNSSSCETRTIPAPDLQPDGVSHSAMSTITISLDEFSGITRSDVRRIQFRMNANTRGTLLMDNIEWVR